MIHRFRRGHLAFLLLVVDVGVSASAQTPTLRRAQDRFVFNGWAGPALPVHLYIPAGIDAESAPILFVMHGTRRDAGRYLRQWMPLALEQGFIAVAPEFSKKDFPGSRGYNLGSVFDGSGKKCPEAKWAFSAIEPLFKEVKRRVKSKRKRYSIYGHSAGAQFVHRYLYYKPAASVDLYIAANAGWYTLPTPTEQYPYGLQNAGLKSERLKLALKKRLVVLLGDRDTDPEDEYLRRTPEAMRQGRHRLARGNFFMTTAAKRASAWRLQLAWTKVIVPDVGHSNAGMAAAAAKLVGD